jgi:hypothetical protein
MLSKTVRIYVEPTIFVFLIFPLLNFRCYCPKGAPCTLPVHADDMHDCGSCCVHKCSCATQQCVSPSGHAGPHSCGGIISRTCGAGCILPGVCGESVIFVCGVCHHKCSLHDAACILQGSHEGAHSCGVTTQASCSGGCGSTTQAVCPGRPDTNYNCGNHQQEPEKKKKNRRGLRQLEFWRNK